MALCDDDFPGTEFDGLFLDLTEAWIELHDKEKGYERKIRNPVMRQMAESHSKHQAGLTPRQRKLLKAVHAQSRRETDELLKTFGAALADACVKGESQVLYDMAEALKAWTQHKPGEPDKRTTLLVHEVLACKHRKERLTFKHWKARAMKQGWREWHEEANRRFFNRYLSPKK